MCTEFILESGAFCLHQIVVVFKIFSLYLHSNEFGASENDNELNISTRSIYLSQEVPELSNALYTRFQTNLRAIKIQAVQLGKGSDEYYGLSQE